MASNHTTNYQLCQWEAADKVLRTDFNQDNAKIDAALAAIAAGNKLVKLAELVTAQDMQQVNLVLPEDDWTNYTQLRLNLDATTSGYSIYIRLNGLTTDSYHTLTTNNSVSGLGTYLIRLPVGGAGVSADGFFAPFSQGQETCAFFQGIGYSGQDFHRWPSAGRAPIPFASLHTLNLYSDGDIEAGSRFSLYGLLR